MSRLLLPLILIVASVIIFFTFTDAMLDEIRGLKTEKISLESGIKQATELLRRQQELHNKYNAISEGQIARLNKLLPENIDNVRLIIDMNNIAKFHGMTVRNVSVSGSDAKEGEGETGESLLNADSVVISFSVSASYDVFKSFLRDLSDSLRLVDVTSVAFNTGESNLYNFNVALKTYWLK